jgi:GTP pyrophosphokinase
MVTLKRANYLDAAGNIDLEAWLDYWGMHRTGYDHLLRTACHINQTLGTHQTTLIGLSCLQYGLNMADILLELHLDKETISAALVYYATTQSKLDPTIIMQKLGNQVCHLLAGVQQMEVISVLGNRALCNKDQLEPIRKMLLAMAADMRVVLIKLAERTVLMRHLHLLPTDHVKQYASETLAIYAPLANRLGIANLKWELEDLAFHALEPKRYRDLARSLQQSLLVRESILSSLCRTLEETLNAAQLKGFNIFSRVKHIYSIDRKMQEKKLKFEDIYDLNAVRILVNTDSECYTALSLIHSRWPSILEQFDDYITKPKPNGYRSLHTVVMMNQHKVEVQIRTFQMHRESEHGLASHWQYKEGQQQKTNYQAKIAWLRQVLAWQKEWVKNGIQFSPKLRTFLNDRIYVLTPKGDIIDLMKGATPIDFAYAIHTHVGHCCRGAKVNGSLVPLTYELKTSDQVEIITAKVQNPSRDWLNGQCKYLITARARAKINRWFKVNEKIAAPIEKENFQAVPEKIILGKPTRSSHESIQVLGLNQIRTQIAHCCKPIPGEMICGFVTQRGVVIHRIDCKDLKNLSVEKQKRLVEVNWRENIKNVYCIDLNIEAYIHPELIHNVSSLIAHERFNLIAVNSETDPLGIKELIKLTIEIPNSVALNKIIMRIKSLEPVIEVNRV